MTTKMRTLCGQGAVLPSYKQRARWCIGTCGFVGTLSCQRVNTLVPLARLNVFDRLAVERPAQRSRLVHRYVSYPFIRTHVSKAYYSRTPLLWYLPSALILGLDGSREQAVSYTHTSPPPPPYNILWRVALSLSVVKECSFTWHMTSEISIQYDGTRSENKLGWHRLDSCAISVRSKHRDVMANQCTVGFIKTQHKHLNSAHETRLLR